MRNPFKRRKANGATKARAATRDPIKTNRDFMADHPELMESLERSVLVEAIWPDAFGGGGCCTARVVGNSRDGYVYLLTRTDNMQREFPLTQNGTEDRGPRLPRLPLLSSPEVPQRLIDHATECTLGGGA